MAIDIEGKREEHGLNLGINFGRVNHGIEELTKVYNDLDDIFKIIKTNTEDLKEYWETKTSKEVFESFEDYYSFLNSTKENIADDISFLKKVVVDSYRGSITTNSQQSDKLDVA